jgi:glucose-1-phosphate thymidylyltransferase
MIAIVLCAGYATRMYPLTRDLPKPLLAVGGRAVLDYLMDQLIDLPDLADIHIVTNDRFYAAFKTWRAQWATAIAASNKTLTLHNDRSTHNHNRLGACRDLDLVFDRIPPSNGYLVSAGDNIYRFDIKPLWEKFRQKRAHHIVALSENDPDKLRKTGVPMFNQRNRIIDIFEKPSKPPAAWACPPLYFLMPTARQLLKQFLATGSDIDAPGHFMRYICHREPLWGFKLEAKRFDIGDMRSYRRADRLLNDKTAIQDLLRDRCGNRPAV